VSYKPASAEYRGGQTLEKSFMSCEMPRVYARDKRTARKEHTCCECRGVIKPREAYNYHHGIWDEPEQYKVCCECDDLRAEIDSEILDPEEGTAFGQLYESVFESHDVATIKRFLDIKRRRGAAIQDWMLKREEESCQATLKPDIELHDIFSGWLDRPTSVEVPLNTEHKAVVSADGIKVGCQTFKLDVIDALVKARDEILKGGDTPR
jgi:hypothetical protein